MKWLMLGVGMVGLVLLQTSAVPAFELLGVAPNLVLVVLCCWVVVRGQGETMVLVPLAGITIGLLSFQGMGESVAAFMPIVLLATLRRAMEPRSEYVWALAIVIVATALHFVSLAVAIEVKGSSIDWLAAASDVLVPSVLVNLLLALLVYWLVRLPTPRPTPHVISPR